MGNINAAGNYDVDGAIAIITLDSPPVNALSAAVRGAIVGGLQRAHADDAIAAVVLLCAGRTFIAGADITEFGKPPQPPSFEEMIVALEDGPKPVIAAIHGTALGGGLETALLCHYRVALPSAKLGLPEVHLGLLPGGGGTQRLPRIVGVESALDLIVTGRSIDAAEAHKAGILDALTEEGQLRAGAVAFARALPAANRPLQRIRDRDDKLAPARGRPEIFETYRKSNPKFFRGVKAPDYIIEAIKGALDLPFEDGIAKERALINELMAGRQSAALRHIFFAEREAAKIIGLPKDIKPAAIQSMAVFGSSLAAPILAKAGLAVNHPPPGQRPDGTAPPDLILIADPETADFASINSWAGPQTIFAASTAADLDRLAAATGHAGQVAGLKFSQRLLEICRRADTAPETVVKLLQLGRKTGKVAVVSMGDFISDRMAQAQSMAEDHLRAEGVSDAEISLVRYDYGFMSEAEPSAAPIDAARQDHIRDALLFPLINTGAALLEEGVAQRASDIDIAMVTGFGWPAYTGGPLFWAATVGLPQVIAGLACNPSALLQKLADAGKNFQSESSHG